MMCCCQTFLLGRQPPNNDMGLVINYESLAFSLGLSPTSSYNLSYPFASISLHSAKWLFTSPPFCMSSLLRVSLAFAAHLDSS